MNREDYMEAVLHLIKNEKKLGLINYPAEILDRCKKFKGERQRAENREERMLPPVDLIPPEKLKKLISEFISSLN